MNKKIKNAIKVLLTFIIFPIISIRLAKYLDFPIQFSIPVYIRLFFLLIGIASFYLFTKNYLLHYFVAENLPFPFSYPKRIIWEGMYLQSRHPVVFFYLLLIISLVGLCNSISGLLILTPISLIILIIYLFYFDKKLLGIFEESYNDYKVKVPFFITLKSPKIKSPHLSRLLAQLFFRFYTVLKNPITYHGLENIPETGGSLFIANHLSYPDPFFVSGGIFRNIRFLTTAEVFKKKLNRLFFYLMGSIPIKRFTKDPSGIRKFFKVMQQGYAVGYFAEGARSWTGEPQEFPAGVTRLLKKVSIPIIPVSISGLYALWPRWAKHMRNAKVEVRFHPQLQNIQEMSYKEFENKLKELIHSDEINFKNELLSKKNLNIGLTSLLWRCPICGEIDALIEYDNDKIKCSLCEAKGILTTDNHLIINDLKKSFSYWYKCVKSFPIDINTYKSKICNLYIGNFPNIKKVDSGTLSIYKSRFQYDGRKVHIFEFSQIRKLHAEGSQVIHFITDNIQVQIKLFNESPLKWEALYQNMLARSQKLKGNDKAL